MLSVASLLNPVKPEPRGTRLPSSTSPSFCTSLSTRGSPQLSTRSSTKKSKMTKDGAIFAKGKIKGEVNFPPFEKLDKETMEEVQKYQVYPLGRIDEYCRHIPYNSEKKSFLERTGRESFEVFQYVFKVPGDEKDYVVMWDYNIGLVRITPFFKCCKYSKTTPAKMLNLNPGLKEITHSITGGALAAQGYWMPYSCALAVCATFCSHISGALIPIFGPTFPSLCVSPDAPEHGRMIIDPAIVTKATDEAENYRIQHTMLSPNPTRYSYSPSHTTPPPSNLERRLGPKRTFDYGTPSDTDMDGNASDASAGVDGVFCSPVTPVSANSPNPNQQPQTTWSHVNMASYSANSSINIQSLPKLAPAPNPLLSAIPRSSGVCDGEKRRQWGTIKRALEEVDADDEYEESTGAVDSAVSDVAAAPDTVMDDAPTHESEVEKAPAVEDQKAAWLLMKLHVADRDTGRDAFIVGDGMESDDGHRVKRRRVLSM
ncbi:hypothetical protein BJ875DRAFT_542516 [Amylocarpus encephaloides]|uniref:HTH APSES-type domain-containing protein n=1 Tax=Amylocarpus encephaloides TaxID=45428 RepID=A0A9P7YJC7_9HELO|nr:hypothetical protein BJ875DRAFT_542516 [Amylocarpus encephaloides]